MPLHGAVAKAEAIFVMTKSGTSGIFGFETWRTYGIRFGAHDQA
jgi:hypothetical protein